jgi:hypothetical protein
MNDEANAGYNEQHQARERIYQEGKGNGEIAKLDPGE